MLCVRLFNVRMYSNDHVILVCRLPVVDIEVPTYELPLPEGVGEEKLHQDNLSARQIEETWREPLLESEPTNQSHLNYKDSRVHLT